MLYFQLRFSNTAHMSHTCFFHEYTSYTHVFYAMPHNLHTTFYFRIFSGQKHGNCMIFLLLCVNFTLFETKNTRAVMFFGNFEQPCTEHEIWTSRLRSFEAKNMKKGIICVDNTTLFAIKGHFWLYFFENTQLLHTYFFYVYTTHTQLHTCHILVFKYSTHVTHM